MLINPYFIHNLAVLVAIVLPALGAAAGLLTATDGMIEATLRQITAARPLGRIFVSGAVMIESAFIAAFIVAITIVLPSYEQINLQISLVELGMALGIGICAMLVAVAGGFIIRGACTAVARQPFFANKIQVLGIILLTLTETPVFFALIVALFMKNNLATDFDLVQGIKMMCAGLLIGLSAIGPSIGQIFFARESCLAVGVNRKAFSEILTLSIFIEALMETPVLFAFVLAVFLLFKKFVVTSVFFATAVFLASTLVVFLGALGAGLCIGLIGKYSVKRIATNEEQYSKVLSTAVLSSIFVETSNIFCFFVAILILLKAFGV